MRRLVKFIVCIVVSLGVLSLSACAATFTDVPANHWAYSEIGTLTERGIVNGMGDGTFAPDSFVTREQFIKLLVLSVGLDVFDMSYFQDPQTRNLQIALFDDLQYSYGDSYSDEYDVYHKALNWSWSAPYVYTAVMNNIIKYGDYTPEYSPDETSEAYSGMDKIFFKPDQPLTRDETARYIARALELSDSAPLSFSDSATIVYGDDVAKTVAVGILKGFEDNTFRPANNTTRAEMAVIMLRILQHVENNPVRKKSFDKVLCDIDTLDYSNPSEMKISGEGMKPYLISRTEWGSLKDGDIYTLNGAEYRFRIIEDGLKGLTPIDSEIDDISIGVEPYDKENYVFIVWASNGLKVYENTGEKHEYSLSDEFMYFSDDNEAGQRWFKCYDKKAFIDKYNTIKSTSIDGHIFHVTLQIVDGKVLFAYDIG